MTNEELQKKVESLEARLNALSSSTTIPFEVFGAFKERFKAVAGLNVSVKSASSENQAVNEAGAGSYSVLGTPDGFDERIDGSLVKYYPFWL